VAVSIAVGVTPVPSLNLVCSEEEGYVTADDIYIYIYIY
jgi:hypothetical protein